MPLAWGGGARDMDLFLGRVMVERVSVDGGSSAKARTIAQWTDIPCGSTASSAEPGTHEFYASVRRHRYEDAPWMLTALGFRSHAGQRVLEVGVGMGTDHAEWHDGGAEAYGVDLTPRHLQLAQGHLRARGHVPRLARADAERLPFADGTFDVVYSFGVIHHTPGTQECVDEMWRVLRPGGRAIVMVYHRHSENYWLNFIMRRGILHGELLRSSPMDIMSRWAESPDSDARPLVKVYSRREARHLFRRFTTVATSVHQLTVRARRALRPFGRTVSRVVERTAGWNLVVDAVK